MNAVLRDNNENNDLVNYIEMLSENAERHRYRAFIKMNQKHFSQRMYKTEKNLMKAIDETEKEDEIYNLFLTLNTFYKPKRTTENIAQFENLYIDLDYYKKGLRLESVLFFLEKDYFNSLIPTPNLIIDSGKGLYLIWHIKPVPIKALPLWQAIERYFLECLKNLGADPVAVDPVRFLRIPGTINLKYNSTVKILETNETSYTLNEIQHEYFTITKKSSPKHKNRVEKITKLFNAYSLYWTRIRDLVRLCEMREYDVAGHRELILFLYRYWSCMILDENEALENTLEINSRFTEKLSKIEVKKATKSAERYYKNKKYNYSNERLIELLNISYEEQQKLETIISKEEKYSRKNQVRNLKRRNEEGLTKREKDKLELEKSIKTLRQQGFTQKQIAKELKKDIRTIKRYC
ncbi:hypothetical protein [Clostridium frigidicarnis]|uniref:Replication protein n=1 Tax=Clostridium frigidicarnis TaxID=84698 RepID=A0A1I1AKJ2_9CLOT|nr:hypothetical protein [Clostridium frigidicarnis]SFB38539.1 hypothetical protein SAMN04488528_103916 [Clostridium frigidicarnis]